MRKRGSRQATDAVQKLETQIELKKKEIDTLEAWQDAADKEKKDVEVAALKAQIAGVEKILDLLKEQKKMHSLEVDAAGAHDYADAAVSAFEKEMALARSVRNAPRQRKPELRRHPSLLVDKAIRELGDERPGFAVEESEEAGSMRLLPTGPGEAAVGCC